MSIVSVIIPVWNQAKYLPKLLGSLDAQSYQDFEVIIVNDGSSDDPQIIFEQYLTNSAPSYKINFYNIDHGGAPKARNFGYSKSTGDLLLFCDADARLEKNALEKMIRTLDANPEVAFVYSSFYWGKKLFKLWNFDPDKLKQMPYVHTMSMVRRIFFPESGWDEDLQKFQDWDLWLTIVENGGQGLWIDEPLFYINPGGTISSWLPGIAYKYCKFLPAVKNYHRSMQIVKNKHHIT